LEKGIGMAYLTKPYNKKATTGLYCEVRGKQLPISITSLPFVPPSYYKN
jgi:aminomethyltransferase